MSQGEVWIVRDPLFGDGGKAKIVDHLTKDERIGAVVRWQGGDNAGHTMVVNGKKIAVHAIPSGVVRAQERPIISVMARGMVANLARAFAELDALAEQGIVVTPENFLISEGLWLTLSYHMALEKARESGPGKKDTTCRAISQTYSSARMYQGVRAGDVRDLDVVRERIKLPLEYHNAILQQVYGQDPITEEKVMVEIEAHRERLLPFLGNEILALNQMLAEGVIVLCEGAQSGMLDVDLGIYPNTTASNTWPGSIQSGCGINPLLITRDIAVIKAYTSRVGAGHLVAEMGEDIAGRIREVGQEYGTTSGRPRRIGWTDQLIGRYCALISKPTELAITKVDVLTGIDPLMVCYGYCDNGNEAPIFPTTVSGLERCKPILKPMRGWGDDIVGITNWKDLPDNARNYLFEVAIPYNAPISMVGTGPRRDQIIVS